MELMVMNISFLVLCGVGGSMVFSSKEFILMEFLGLVVIVIRWGYSKTFLSNAGFYNSTMTIMNCSAALLVMVGGSGFSGVDQMSVLGMTVLRTLLINSISGYVTNK